MYHRHYDQGIVSDLCFAILMEAADQTRERLEARRRLAYRLERDIDWWVVRLRDEGRLAGFVEFWHGIIKLDEDLDEIIELGGVWQSN